MKKTILKDIFETKIGAIELSINCEINSEIYKLNNLSAENLNYKITVQTIDLNNFKLPKNMKIDSSKGWRIYIEKKT